MSQHNSSILRPEVRLGAIRQRGRGMSRLRLAGIKKGLLALHTLEVMAVNIYKYQITNKESEHNRQLIAAMFNEMTHVQDFQVKLYEYGFRPSKFRWAYWLVGLALGFGSRIFGKRIVLKTGVWVESKAVHHYAQLLRDIEWDDDTRKVVKKNQSDEDEHISRWKGMLDLLLLPQNGV